MFTTIVVGVDGLPGGRDALALAQRLADLAGGALVAVHVHPYEPFPIGGLRPDIEALAHDQAQALLEGQLTEAGVHARAIATAETSPGRGLHRIADGLDADLIVIGSPHRGALGRVVAGDSARAVVQGATCPVLVARPSATRRRSPARPSASLGRLARGPHRARLGGTIRLGRRRHGPRPLRGGAPAGVLAQHLLRHQLGGPGARAPRVRRDPRGRGRGRARQRRHWRSGRRGAPATSWSGCPSTWTFWSSARAATVRSAGPCSAAPQTGSSTRAACPVIVVPRGAHEDHAAERAVAPEVTAG